MNPTWEINPLIFVHDQQREPTTSIIFEELWWNEFEEDESLGWYIVDVEFRVSFPFSPAADIYLLAPRIQVLPFFHCLRRIKVNEWYSTRIYSFWKVFRLVHQEMLGSSLWIDRERYVSVFERGRVHQQWNAKSIGEKASALHVSSNKILLLDEISALHHELWCKSSPRLNFDLVIRLALSCPFVYEEEKNAASNLKFYDRSAIMHDSGYFFASFATARENRSNDDQPVRWG